MPLLRKSLEAKKASTKKVTKKVAKKAHKRKAG
jgi:hypothetical protein